MGVDLSGGTSAQSLTLVWERSLPSPASSPRSYSLPSQIYYQVAPAVAQGVEFLCSEGTSGKKKNNIWGLGACQSEERVWLLCFFPPFPTEPKLHRGRKVPLAIQGLLVKWDAPHYDI